MPVNAYLPAAVASIDSSREHQRCHVGMVGTYPPTLCGLATFTAALAAALQRAGNCVDVVPITECTAIGSLPLRAPVVAELVSGSRASLRGVVDVLSRCDAVIVQHEFGIFGGFDGDEALALFEALAADEVPTIVVLHTVPCDPTGHQRAVLESVVDAADAVVVMSASAESRLVDGYSVLRSKVTRIPHGASIPSPELSLSHAHRQHAPALLTWGLLGPGKGIEHVIDALALLDDEGCRPRYVVAGTTHPKVAAANGEAYRHSLIQRTFATRTSGAVTFDDRYRSLKRLTHLVSSAGAIVLPYDSRDQVTSGVLVDAIAAGRPVIATEFPHAAELLSSGAGILVPHGDARALADAIRVVVSDRGAAESMSAEARRLAPALSWDAVAAQYAQLAQRRSWDSTPVTT